MICFIHVIQLFARRISIWQKTRNYAFHLAYKANGARVFYAMYLVVCDLMQLETEAFAMQYTRCDRFNVFHFVKLSTIVNSTFVC